jgi:hypothetical protein
VDTVKELQTQKRAKFIDCLGDYQLLSKDSAHGISDMNKQMKREICTNLLTFRGSCIILSKWDKLDKRDAN